MIDEWLELLISIVKIIGKDTLYFYEVLTTFVVKKIIDNNFDIKKPLLEKLLISLVESGKGYSDASFYFSKMLKTFTAKEIINDTNFVNRINLLISIAESAKKNTFYVYKTLDIFVRTKIINSENFDKRSNVLLNIFKLAGKDASAVFKMLRTFSNEKIIDNFSFDSRIELLLLITESQKGNSGNICNIVDFLVIRKLLIIENFDDRDLLIKKVTLLANVFDQNKLKKLKKSWQLFPKKIQEIILKNKILTVDKKMVFIKVVADKSIDGLSIIYEKDLAWFFEEKVDEMMRAVFNIKSNILKKIEKKLKSHFKDIGVVLLTQLMFPEKFYSEEKTAVNFVKLARDSSKQGIPLEILEDEELMETLLVSLRRVSNVFKDENEEEFEKILKELFKDASDEKIAKKERKKKVNEYIKNLIANRDEIELLKKQEYSEKLWEEEFYLIAKIETRIDIKSSLKSDILNHYREYIDILENQNIKKIKINENKTINSTKLFKDNLKIDEINEQKDAIIELFKNRLKNTVRIYTIKNLGETAEEKYGKTKTTKQKKKSLLVKISINNFDFFEQLKRCSHRIAGCYAPNGSNKQKPFQNAMMANSAVISIYEKNTNKEIENSEVVFTDKGMFVYKIYSSGHLYDTHPLWVKFFKELLDKNIVPAIILSDGFEIPGYTLLRSKGVEIEKENGEDLKLREVIFKNIIYDFSFEGIRKNHMVLTKGKLSSDKINLKFLDSIEPKPMKNKSKQRDGHILMEKIKEYPKLVSKTFLFKAIKSFLDGNQSIEEIASFLKQGLLDVVNNDKLKNSLWFKKAKDKQKEIDAIVDSVIALVNEMRIEKEKIQLGDKKEIAGVSA